MPVSDTAGSIGLRRWLGTERDARLVDPAHAGCKALSPRAWPSVGSGVGSACAAASLTAGQGVPNASTKSLSQLDGGEGREVCLLEGDEAAGELE